MSLIAPSMLDLQGWLDVQLNRCGRELTVVKAVIKRSPCYIAELPGLRLIRRMNRATRRLISRQTTDVASYAIPLPAAIFVQTRRCVRATRRAKCSVCGTIQSR